MSAGGVNNLQLYSRRVGFCNYVTFTLLRCDRYQSKARYVLLIDTNLRFVTLEGAADIVDIV